MDLLLSVIFAWIAAVSVILLSIIYILRKVAGKKKGSFLYKLNKVLRRYHKPLGIIAIITGFIHGLYSALPILSGNKGTILLVVMILLGLGFMLRKKMRGKWALSHRIMAVIACALLILHILEVGGFVGIDGLQKALEADGYLVSIETEDSTDKSNLEENDSIEITTETPSVEDTSTTTPDTDTSSDIIVNDANNIFADDVILQDGTYYGTADAFGPDLETEVIVENGLVTAVNIVSHNEKNSSIYGPAMDYVPSAIVEEQTTEVDSISGATYTSYGIMMSVENALADAIAEGTLPGVEMPSISKGHH